MTRRDNASTTERAARTRARYNARRESGKRRSTVKRHGGSTHDNPLRHAHMDSFRNAQGLLIQKHQKVPIAALDMPKICQHVLHLQKHYLIACFVKKADDMTWMEQWISELKNIIQVQFASHQEARFEYFYIQFSAPAVT